MVRDILIWPHATLKKRSDPAPLDGQLHHPAAQMLFRDLKETVLAAEGLGLSAIQIGVPLRVLVTNFGEQGPQIWVNPKIVERSPTMVTGEEGCLSLPGVFEKVKRHKMVYVTGFDENGEPKAQYAFDYLARLFQHEIDHFEGLVYPDRMDPGARDRIRRKLRKAA